MMLLPSPQTGPSTNDVCSLGGGGGSGKSGQMRIVGGDG